MPWVLRGIVNPDEWLVENDPRKEEMVVIQEEDVEGAIKRARFRDAIQKTTRKIKGAAGAALGILGKLTSRNSSSVNMLNDQGDSASATGSVPATPELRPTGEGATTRRTGRSMSSAAQHPPSLHRSATEGRQHQRSREASPSPSTRSPLGLWSRFNPLNREGVIYTEPSSAQETPRSGSPVVTKKPPPLKPGTNVVSLTEDPHIPSGTSIRSFREDIQSSAKYSETHTPKPRRSSASLLSPPPGHVRRTSSLSGSTRLSVEENHPPLNAEELTATLKRNKTVMAQRDQSLEREKSTGKASSWLSRLRHGRRKPATTSVTPAPMTPITTTGRPLGAPRSVSAAEFSGSDIAVDDSLRYRKSHDVHTDTSSLGGQSWNEGGSPLALKGFGGSGEGLRQQLHQQQYPQLPPPALRHHTDEEGEFDDLDQEGEFYIGGCRESTDSRVSFSLTDDSEYDFDGEDVDIASGNDRDILFGSGGYSAMHNTGSGWQPMPSRRHPDSGSAASSISGQQVENSGYAYRPQDLNVDTHGLGGGISNYSARRHASSPLAQRSFSPEGHTLLHRGSISEDIDEEVDDDEEEEEEEEEDVLMVKRRHGGSIPPAQVTGQPR